MLGLLGMLFLQQLQEHIKGLLGCSEIRVEVP